MNKKDFNPAQFLYAIVYDGKDKDCINDFKQLFGNVINDFVKSLEKFITNQKYENAIKALMQ